MKRTNKNKGGTIVKKRSVSALPELFEAADKVMEQRRISNFSEYVRSLINRDLNGEFKHQGV